jgi:hypothetical protein
VHEPIGRGINRQCRAKRDRAIEAAAPEGLVDCRRIRRDCAGDHPDGDLRLIAEERVAEHALPRAKDGDDDSRRDVVDLGDVRSVDPGMAATNAVLAFRRDNNGGSATCKGVWHLNIRF